MVYKYFSGTTPEARESADIDNELIELFDAVAPVYAQHMDNMQFSVALTEVWKLIGRANKYIDETMPWILAKDEQNSARLAAVLYNLCETLRVSAIFIKPAMPETAAAIFEQLGISGERHGQDAKMGQGRHIRLIKAGAVPENCFPEQIFAASISGEGRTMIR